MEELGKRLRELRIKTRFTQSEIAKMLNVPRLVITNIEAGKRKITAEELYIFAQIYGISMEELYTGKDAEKRSTKFLREFEELSEKSKNDVIEFIKYDKILRHIPGICDIYFKTTQIMPLLALKNKNSISDYIIEGDKMNDEIQNIMQEVGIVGNVVPREHRCYCSINMKCKNSIEECRYSKKNMYYQKYLVIPEKFTEGVKDINIAFYCYLLIMSYGMLVRYNAHKWECFIDKKNSKESILIELSVRDSVINFYYQIHYMLFKYYYEEDSYNDVDVKKVIQESTKDIMNNITKEIEHHNLQYNTQELLPWDKNYK